MLWEVIKEEDDVVTIDKKTAVMRGHYKVKDHIVGSWPPAQHCSDCPPVAQHTEKDPADEYVNFKNEVTNTHAGCRREDVWALGINVSASLF